MKDFSKLIVNNIPEAQLNHRQVDKLIADMSRDIASVERYNRFLKDLKPYIDRGMCKVRFIDYLMDMTVISKMIDDEGKDGWVGIVGYNLFKNQALRKGMFTNIASMLIFKKYVDVKEAELLDGLENGGMIKL